MTKRADLPEFLWWPSAEQVAESRIYVGVRAVAERCTQIEPKVLVAVDGYVCNGRSFDVRATAQQLRAAIPSRTATVLVDYVPGRFVEVAEVSRTLIELSRGR